MAQNNLDPGTSPNNGSGDPLRIAAQKINANFNHFNDLMIGIGSGEGGKSYATLADAQAVSPKPADGTVFQVEEAANAGFWKFDSTQTGGTKFVREFLKQDVETNLIEEVFLGGINSNGSFFSNSAIDRTDFISVQEGDVLVYSGVVGSGYLSVAGYSSNSVGSFTGDLLTGTGAVLTDVEITVPAGVNYVVASSRNETSAATNYPLSLEKTEKIDSFLKTLSPLTVENIEKTLGFQPSKKTIIEDVRGVIDLGGIFPDGKFFSSSAIDRTDFIPVKEGDVFKYSGNVATDYPAIAGYSSESDLSFINALLTGINAEVKDIEVTIPSGIEYIVATSRNLNSTGNTQVLVFDLILETESTLKRLNREVRQNEEKPAVIVEPLPTNTTSTRTYREFNVHSLIPSLGEYLVHHFVEIWNRNTNADRGWYCPEIKFRGKVIAHGEFNFIHMISYSSDPASPFYNESYHVGTTHGCELWEKEIFMIDGKEFLPENLTENLYGDNFTMLMESTIYASDGDAAANGDNNVFKLDGSGNKIASTKHWMHATIEGNNKIRLRNKLRILRDNTKFIQAHIGMLSCVPDYFQFEQIYDPNWTANEYPFSDTDAVRQAPVPISPSTEIIGEGNLTIPKSNQSYKWGKKDGLTFQVRCRQIGNEDKANHIFMRTLTTNKTYLQPINTMATGSPDVFMIGDEIEGEVITEFNVRE